MVEPSEIERKIEKLGLSYKKLTRFVDDCNDTIINIGVGKQQNPTIETTKEIVVCSIYQQKA